MEKLFLKLPEIVRDQAGISQVFGKDTWKTVQYRTKMGEGTMLLAAEEAHPRSVTFTLGLSGWYRIFIGLPHMRSASYTYLKLSDELCYTGLRQARRGNPMDHKRLTLFAIPAPPGSCGSDVKR